MTIPTVNDGPTPDRATTDRAVAGLGRWPVVVGAVVFLAGSLLHSPEHPSKLSLWTLISDSVFVFT